MKKILIIGNGVIGAHFIDRVVDTYTSENIYYIIEPKEREHANASPGRFKFFTFDPTSLHKIINLLKMDFVQVIITMQSKMDIEYTIKNIRTFKKSLRIIVLDQHNCDNDDPSTHFINSNELLASRMIDFLPNVPVIAQNVGKGEGEIMEVLVPFASTFVYRHIGVIEQKGWRIVAIYRNNELKLPTSKTMIHPNDLLLLVGDPAVLKSVYRTIKRELGQFPAPFGSNIYFYIDMLKDREDHIVKMLEQAAYLNEHFASYSMIIKVVNPGNIKILREIKKYRSDTIDIDICYNERPEYEVILDDIKKYHVGLVIVSQKMFSSEHIRSILYECNVPVLKLSMRSLKDLKDSVLLLTDNRDFEKVSTAIFDITEQMGYNMELINYLNENQSEKEQVIEHYRSLSSIFSKSIKITELTDNPIRELNQRDNFLQCLPFTERIVESDLFSWASTDSERLYERLYSYHQIFIPVRI
ncbi:MAG: TrkA C-terminal domain-containing protein [Campylobacterota bacterium]|nr:TrkA C-terminal domain-containing protein [Campylobacterota bacterium]